MLARLRARGQRSAVMMLDLDHFKRINDEHGHRAGDLVLRRAAQAIRKAMRADSLLARYGGDEYTVILPGADSTRALEVAENIRLRVLQEVFLAHPGSDGRPALNIQGHFSASVGVASYRECVFPASIVDLEHRRQHFIRIADEAMYRAKRQGKNQVCLGCQREAL